MVKLNEINNTATFAWSHSSVPVLATGSAAGVIDDDFSSTSTLQFHALQDKTPILSVDADSKFYDLDWSKNNTLLAGALENGTIQFWNTEKLSSGTVTSVAKGQKHTGAVKSLQFNPIQHNVLASGGANGEIYIWDANKLENLVPFVPGTAMTPMDTVTSVAWNNSVSNIFGSAGSAGYTSIWDLKSKKEVLHLTYTSPTGTRASLSTVAWHPTQSTKLITASESDGAPVILTWDLRNSNAPETILAGHKKGILSLDWNAKDPSLLLSCGKDNTTLLWNPLTGTKLAQYPTTANWAFKTRFAPSAPDVFASASFDKKVIVQTLQDTSPPVSKRISSVNDNDFWNEISTTETQQPQYFVMQAPNWLGRQSSVAFGFGAKLVTVSKTGVKNSDVKISKAKLPGSAENAKLKTALESLDFKPIIESRLQDSYEGLNKADWELLDKLAEGDVYQKFIALSISDEETEAPTSGEGFYDNLQQWNGYVPSGELKLNGSKDLTNALLTKNLERAVDLCLKDDRLTEALVIALNGPESLKQKVTDYYFSKNAEKDSISRLLYSVSLGDVSDIVENGDIASWREIGTAIDTYSTDKAVYKTQFTKLGDRVLANKNRDYAILNYVNASALDKVADIWNSELKDLEMKILSEKNSSAYDAHFESLSEFVEKFGAYRATLNLDAPVPESASSLATILEYIDIISTNGQFELASKILGLLSSEVPAVKLEQDRILKATFVSNSASRATAGRYGALNASAVAPATTTYQARDRAPATNPYMTASSAPIVNSQSQFTQPPGPSYGYQPPSASQAPYAPQTTYAPQAPAYGSQAHNPYKPVAATPTSVPTAGPPPPKNLRRQETEGWNDLPTQFHKQPSRRTSAAPSNIPGANSAPTPPLSRIPSHQNAPQMPPPPRSMSKTPKLPSGGTTPVIAPPVPVSRYAPASPQPNISSLKSLTSGQVQHPTSYSATASAPPKNPYAPNGQFATAPPVSNSYAAPEASYPHAGNGGQASSPYGAPPAGGFTNGAQLAPSNAYSAPAAPSNPYAPQNSAAPPVFNSYAPQALSTAVAGSPYAAPPPATQGPPPVIRGPPKNFGAPPSGGLKPAEQSQQLAKEKYPSGDRSHIPDAQKKVFDVLQSTLETIKPAIPSKFEKQVIDTEKRLNILFDHLNNEDLLTPPTLALLDQLADNLIQKEFSAALDIFLDITANHSEEGGHWAVGVKRLIQFAEACA